MIIIIAVIIAMIDCAVDEGVGPEDFEDPKDFVESGKQPFDHVKKPFLLHGI